MKVVVQKGWIFQFLPQSGQLVYYVGWAWGLVRATAPSPGAGKPLAQRGGSLGPKVRTWRLLAFLR